MIRNRPTDRSDACWTSLTTRIDEVFGYQLAGTRETLFPTFGDKRTAAAAADAVAKREEHAGGGRLATGWIKGRHDLEQPLEVVATAARRERPNVLEPEVGRVSAIRQGRDSWAPFGSLVPTTGWVALTGPSSPRKAFGCSLWHDPRLWTRVGSQHFRC